MTRVFVLAAALLPALIPTLHAAAQTGAALNLMPLPRDVQRSSGSFAIREGQTFALSGVRSARLQAALLRAAKRIEDTSGVPLPRSITSGTAGTFTVNVAADGAPVQGIDEDESYKLVVSTSGVMLTAPTTVGALHGLETLVQLLQATPAGDTLPLVSIDDSPRFRWRGLMIDCVRHFEPMDVLKRNLDAMAAVKLNVFHWHLIDDQGFRIESKLYPKLTTQGSDGRFYTQDDARELVRYAWERGIRVVPEFEMPGHSTAWLVAYPELNSGTQPDGIRQQFGVSDVALDPTRDATYRFIDRFLTEMTGIFPDSYVHIGGDETPAPDWKTNPRITAFMQMHNLKDNEALQAYFNQRVLAILTKLHRRMVGWDEIFSPTLPKDVVIQSWRGDASLAKAAEQGYQGVLSAPYYLDGMKSAGEEYLADPVPADTKLTPEQQRLILGGEVCMWAEQLDQRTIDSRIWPRTAAIAERFWSPQSMRDVNDMYRRLQPVSIELESVGTRHLTSEDAGLRSLAESTELGGFHTFAQAFEPVSFGERYQQQHTSQLTPLTGFVDAVVPDPPVKHELALAVDAVLASSAGASDQYGVLRSYFTKTAGSVPAVQGIIARQPRLQPITERATQLQPLCQLALQALDMIQAGRKANGEWSANADKLLAEAGKPSGIVRFVFLDPLTQLVHAVR